MVTKSKMTTEEENELRLMKLVAQAILKEDKKLFEELAKH